jgi:hypothetical protein
MSIFKLLFAIIFDAADCLIGRIPLFGTVFDILGVYLTFVLCGPLGITYAWEIIDITDQIDGFIPTMTLLYLISSMSESKQQTYAPSQEYMARKKGKKRKKNSKKRAQ